MPLTDDIDKDVGADGRTDGACPLKRAGLHERAVQAHRELPWDDREDRRRRLFCARKALWVELDIGFKVRAGIDRK